MNDMTHASLLDRVQRSYTRYARKLTPARSPPQAAADEKLRAKLEAQSASLADLEQKHEAAAKLAAAFERQMRLGAASAQRELGKRDEIVDDLRKQLDEREKDLRHALLRVSEPEKWAEVLSLPSSPCLRSAEKESSESLQKPFAQIRILERHIPEDARTRAASRARTAGGAGAVGSDGRPLWVTDWRDGLPWEASSPAVVDALSGARGGSASGRAFFGRLKLQSPPGAAMGFSPPGTAQGGARRLPPWDPSRGAQQTRSLHPSRPLRRASCR